MYYGLKTTKCPNLMVKMTKMTKIYVFSTSYDHKYDVKRKVEYHFWNPREISYKIRPKIFFYKIITWVQIRVTKKKESFLSFSLYIPLKIRFFCPISPQWLSRPLPSHLNLRNKVFLGPHNTPEVTIIVIKSPPPKILSDRKQ